MLVSHVWLLLQIVNLIKLEVKVNYFPAQLNVNDAFYTRLATYHRVRFSQMKIN